MRSLVADDPHSADPDVTDGVRPEACAPSQGSLTPPNDARILWIDDETREDDGSVYLLKFELGGLAVDCAESGAAGLRLALTRDYVGIILDLRLPDIDGLSLLNRMMAAGVEPPVLVLSGWTDAESTIAALKFGAVNVRSKPLTGDALIQAVRDLLSSPWPSQVGRETERRRHGGLVAAGGTHFSVGLGHAEPLVIIDAARALTRPTLSALEFIALARAFRAICLRHHLDASSDRNSMTRPGITLVPDVRLRGPSQLVPNRAPAREGHRARAIVTQLDTDIANGILPSEGEIAQSFDLSASAAGRLLKEQLGVGFPELRRTLRVRATIREIAYSIEQVAQIAYGHGYEHPGNFIRDFRLTLGPPPRQFRRYFLSPL